MPITTFNLGPNTRQFSTSADANGVALIPAVAAFLATRDWTQIDDWTTFQLRTMVFTAPNLDGATSKVLILYWDTVENKMYTSSCESWNSTTHTALNEVFNFNNTFPVPFLPNGTDFIVFANPRYAIFQSYVTNEPSAWSGVFELEREAPEDTVAYGLPCWGWANSHYFGASTGAINTVNGNNWGNMSLPRTRSGATGVAAARNMYVNTSIGSYPAPAVNTTYGVHISEALAYINAYGYGWDTNKTTVSTMKLMEGIAATVQPATRGRICAVKASPIVGEAMNKVSLPVDTNLFHSATGTPTDHWVLNCTAKSSTSNVNDVNFNTTNYYTAAVVTSAGAITAVASNGLFYYCATSSGVNKVSVANHGVVAVPGTGNSSDIKYDGGQYMYVATTSGVQRIDTLNNDAVTSLAISGGCFVIALHTTKLVATHRNWVVNPQFSRIDLATFTIDNTFTSASAASSYFLTACVDYSGNFYLAMDSSNNGGNHRYYRINSVDNTSFLKAATGIQGSQAALYFDGVSINHFMLTLSTTGYRYVINPSTLDFVTTQTLTVVSTAASGALARVAALNGRYYWGGNSIGIHYMYSIGPKDTISTDGASRNYTTNPVGATGNQIWTAGLSTDGVRMFLANGSSTLAIINGFNNRYKAGQPLGQFLLPV